MICETLTNAITSANAGSFILVVLQIEQRKCYELTDSAEMQCFTLKHFDTASFVISNYFLEKTHW